MFCPKCGKNIMDNAKFCNLCGADLRKIVQSRPSSHVPSSHIPDFHISSSHLKSILTNFKFHLNNLNNDKLKELVKNAKNMYTGKNKKRNIIITSSALCVVTGLIIAGSVANNPASKIVKNIENKKYNEAIQVYNTKLSGKYDPKLEEKIAEYMVDVKKDYNNNKLSTQEVENILDTINYVCSGRNIQISNLYDDISSLMYSKNSFENGQSAFDRNNYSAAIDYFSCVISDDNNYEEAQKKIEECEKGYKSSIFEEAEEFANKENYSQAISVLKDNSAYLENDEEYNKRITEYCDKITDEAKNSINDYFGKYDYEGACSYINNLISEYPDIKELNNILNNMQKDYANYILEAAKKDFDEKDYSSAANTIEIGINQIGEDNADLNNTYSEYKSYLPTYINDLEYLSCSYYDAVMLNEDLKDNTGEEHRHSWCIYDSYGDYGVDVEDYAEYFLNGKYNTFSGKCGVSYEMRSNDNTKYFDVYADDVLVYTSPVMNSNSLPVDFSIDVTGVKVLKISYPALSKHIWSNSLAVIYDGVFTRNE